VRSSAPPRRQGNTRDRLNRTAAADGESSSASSRARGSDGKAPPGEVRVTSKSRRYLGGTRRVTQQRSPGSHRPPRHRPREGASSRAVHSASPDPATAMSVWNLDGEDPPGVLEIIRRSPNVSRAALCDLGRSWRDHRRFYRAGRRGQNNRPPLRAANPGEPARKAHTVARSRPCAHVNSSSRKDEGESLTLRVDHGRRTSTKARGAPHRHLRGRQTRPYAQRDLSMKRFFRLRSAALRGPKAGGHFPPVNRSQGDMKSIRLTAHLGLVVRLAPRSLGA